MRLYTVGHSTRSSEEFRTLLDEYLIKLVVDVRRYPGSRRHPHFGSDALRDLLESARIGYEHEVDLGGRRPALADSPHRAWRNSGFRGYADFMETALFQSALERLERRGVTTTTAIMCAEAVPWRCHRQLIADQLVARGAEVVHILGPARSQPHSLNPAARPLPDGRLIYDRGGEQLGLLDQ